MALYQKKIAIVLDPLSARRLVESMFAYLKPDRLVWLIDAHRPVPEIIEQLKVWRPDGIVVRVKPDLHRALMEMGKPIVISGGNRAEHLVSSVGSDNDKVGAEAARHLMSLGLRSFGFLGMNAPFAPQRQRGFIETLHQAGFEAVEFNDPSVGWHHYMEMPHTPHAGLARWLADLPKPAGVFAAHDPLGWHLAHMCLHSRISVPEEIAIVGANNDELVCKLSRPPLSSIALPWQRTGAETALEIDRLVDAMEAGDTEGMQGRLIRLPPEGVVIRQSTDMLAIENPILRRAIAYIKAHASEPITVSDVVNQLPVSRRKLEIDFIRHLNRTPKEEIMRVRIERAKIMLAETDLPISMVAERCGFNYADRFAACFRQAVGMSPLAFRKSMRARDAEPARHAPQLSPHPPETIPSQK